MAGRPKLGRAVAAITGASVALMLAALPASAEDPATATYKDKHEAGLEVNIVFLDGDEKEQKTKLPTRLSEIALKDGPAVQTYSLVPGSALEKGTELIELPWEISDEDVKTQLLAKIAEDDDFLKKMNWTLRHSYPFVGLDALKTAASVDGLGNKEAIAATQAALWHFFFGDFDLADDNDAKVKALYKYLTGDKNTGAENDAAPELVAAPGTLSGKAGDRVGPVKVKTTGKSLSLTLPAGVKVVDKDGKEIAAKDLKDGSELFFQLPAGAAGEATVEIKAGGAEAARVFGGGDFPEEPELKATQLQVTEHKTRTDGIPFDFVVFAQKLTKSANVKLSWTGDAVAPAPQASNGGLADTGVSIYVPIGLGVLLLAAGAGALLFLRRRGSRA